MEAVPGMTPDSREPLGIPGLDEAIGGGAARGDVILISGPPGTGKTTLALQAASSCVRRGSRIAYVSAATEPFSVVVRFASKFGFFDAGAFLAKCESHDLMASVRRGSTVAQAIESVMASLEAQKPGLVVIDPVTVIREYAEPAEYRKILDSMLARVRALDATVVMTGEFPEGLAESRVEAYLADASISLFVERTGIRGYRSLRIHKYRGVGHPLDTMRYEITPGGAVVFPARELAE